MIDKITGRNKLGIIWLKVIRKFTLLMTVLRLYPNHY